MGRDARRRIVDTVCTFFGIPARGEAVPVPSPPAMSGAQRPASAPAFQFTEQPPEVSPKQFIHEKSPTTEVERVACLAYYLAHYRGTPHFQTKDITALNTEAAARPFSNTTYSVDNATKGGYLVPSVKGHKQISVYGERFVEALPDRQAAREAMEKGRPKRGGSAKSTNRD